MESRDEARSRSEMLSFTEKKEQEPLMQYLIEFRGRMEHPRELLTDPSKTAFFFVTLPEALPIAVITRFINWFSEFGIPVGAVLVNMRIDRSVVTPESAAFVRNRLAMQDEHMQTIWEKFDSQVRALVPLFEDEVRGSVRLRRLAGEVFSAPA